MTRIPDNEFSEQFTADMPSADTMYHNYMESYSQKTCVRCGYQWMQKNSEPMLSDLCYKCRKEKLDKMNEGKI
jgi:hypothetical protein